jgi:hypothetical protein
LSPIGALVGVFLGAWLSRASSETTWLKERRIDRYTGLLEAVDLGNRKLRDVLTALASPARFPSRREWDAHVEGEARALEEATAKVVVLSSEVSLFASKRVSDAAVAVLDGWNKILGALSVERAPMPVPAESPQSSPIAPETLAQIELQRPSEDPDAETLGAVPPTENSDEMTEAESWPAPEALDAAAVYEEARADVEAGLTGLRGILVQQLRADLGVDQLSVFRRGLLWVRARLGRDAPHGEAAPVEEESSGSTPDARPSAEARQPPAE